MFPCSATGPENVNSAWVIRVVRGCATLRSDDTRSEAERMTQHRHDFLAGFDPSRIAFGLDRALAESSLKAYLQMFSDDALLAALVPRLSDAELDEVVRCVGGLLKRHLTEGEYHALFLKDGEE